MTKQFKHESENYIPIVNCDDGTLIRPDWVPIDEVLIYVENPFSKDNKKISKLIKINSLSGDEFIKYQKEGRIPKDYKIKDWIK